MTSDYYQVLKVDPTATSEEIKKAYHEEMQFCHPDKWRSNPRMHQKAEERAKELNEAYEVLGDPAKRRVYDALRNLLEQSHRQTPPEQPPSPAPTLSRQSPAPPNMCFALPDLVEQRALRRLRFGHIHNAILLSDNELLLVSAGGARLVDVLRDRILWDIDCPASHSVISANRNVLALAGTKQIYLWNLWTKDLLGQLKDNSHPLALNPEGSLLACGNGRTLDLWDTRNAQMIRRIEGHTDPILAAAFSPDGQTLATASCGQASWPWQKNDRSVAFWDVASARGIARWKMGKDDGPRALAFSPTGSSLAIAHESRGISVWDVRSGQELQRLVPDYGPAFCAAFSADERLLASGDVGGRLYLWDLKDGRELWHLEGHKLPVYGVSFSPSGRILASVTAAYSGSYFAVDRPVRLWDVEHGRELCQLGGLSRDEVDSVAFSRDGRLVASGGGLSAHIWDVASGQEIQQLAEDIGVVHSIAFSPDGNAVASGGLLGVTLWDTMRGWKVRQMEPPYKGHPGINSVAFSPDGQHLAASVIQQPLLEQEVSPEVWVWNLADCRKARRLKGHRRPATQVTFSPDGQLIASSSADRSVILWEVASGRKVHRLWHTDNVSSVHFAPSGQILASGSLDKTVKLWNTASGQEIMSLQHGHSVHSVALGPDERLLASGTSDGTVHLWHVATGQQVRRLEGHTDRVQSVAFSPDGQLVASGSWDGVVRLWQVRS